jgi:hypothetical protein
MQMATVVTFAEKCFELLLRHNASFKMSYGIPNEHNTALVTPLSQKRMILTTLNFWK